MPETPDSDTFAERLLRFLSGDLPPDDAHEMDALLARRPELQALAAEVRQLLPGPYAVPEVVDVDAGWRRVEALMDERGGARAARHAGARTRRARHTRGTRHVFSVPVWVALAAAGVVMVVWGRRDGPGPAGGPTPSPVSTYVTGNGQRATITLPDGNTVSLNVASRLEVPADYLRGDRTLHLTGEALFVVAHRPATPFTIVAGPATARVLGTSFVVRHYMTDKTATVAVRDGKVAVGPWVLTARQLVDVDERGTSRVRTATAAQFSFASGVLSLGDMTLTAAIPELNRWYDADLRIGDPALATRHVKGDFTAGSLSDLAVTLGWIFDVRVVRNGRTLTLFRRG